MHKPRLDLTGQRSSIAGLSVSDTAELLTRCATTSTTCLTNCWLKFGLTIPPFKSVNRHERNHCADRMVWCLIERYERKF